MKHIDVVINGRGLDSPINGIPRYMYEVICHLDSLLDHENINVEVVVPQNCKINFKTNNIKVVELNHHFLWDYTEAENYAKKKGALYVNLASKGTLYKNSICTIHDIRVLLTPMKFVVRDIKNRIKTWISYKLAVSNAKKLVTISDFSKSEIVDFFSIPESKISVTGCGWEHIKEIEEDDSIFNEYPEITKGCYYFSLGSIAPHKNFKWIIENKKSSPDAQYVIMGNVDTRNWADSTGSFTGIIYVGYQSDGRMLALMKNAKAFVFPTLYEGFGIPPLEALACGTSTIVSNIPVMKEIYKNSVYYIDPNYTNVNLNELLKKQVESPVNILSENTWIKVAERWMELIKKSI